ncbi:hypothetical protein A2U01_0035539, partial [Trifolium medium]|nr:hypothetical protein [Trifolium medium]
GETVAAVTGGGEAETARHKREEKWMWKIGGLAVGQS